MAYIDNKCVDDSATHSMSLAVRSDGAYCPRCGKKVLTKEQCDKGAAEYNERMGIIK